MNKLGLKIKNKEKEEDQTIDKFLFSQIKNKDNEEDKIMNQLDTNIKQ